VACVDARVFAECLPSTTLESGANATLEIEATGSVCLVCLVLGSDAGQAVDAASAGSVAGAFEGEDVGVVHGYVLRVNDIPLVGPELALCSRFGVPCGCG
jgi:hypothetical protein